MPGPNASLYGTAVYGTDTYGDPEVTLESYGTAIYGTSRYGQQNVTFPVNSASIFTTVSLGTVLTSAVDAGQDLDITFTGVKTTVALGIPNITAAQFDFEAVKDNYERTRTVYVHRLTTASDRTVKVA